jgi:hypothetical protein
MKYAWENERAAQRNERDKFDDGKSNIYDCKVFDFDF